MKTEWLRSGGAAALLALLILIAVNLAIRYTDVYLAALQFTRESSVIENGVGTATTLFVLPVFVTYGRRDSDYYKRARILMLVSGSRRNGVLYFDIDQHPTEWIVSAATVCLPFACDSVSPTAQTSGIAVPR